MNQKWPVKTFTINSYGMGYLMIHESMIKKRLYVLGWASKPHTQNAVHLKYFLLFCISWLTFCFWPWIIPSLKLPILDPRGRPSCFSGLPWTTSSSVATLILLSSFGVLEASLWSHSISRAIGKELPQSGNVKFKLAHPTNGKVYESINVFSFVLFYQFINNNLSNPGWSRCSWIDSKMKLRQPNTVMPRYLGFSLKTIAGLFTYVNVTNYFMNAMLRSLH